MNWRSVCFKLQINDSLFRAPTFFFPKFKMKPLNICSMMRPMTKPGRPRPLSESINDREPAEPLKPAIKATQTISEQPTSPSGTKNVSFNEAITAYTSSEWDELNRNIKLTKQRIPRRSVFDWGNPGSQNFRKFLCF